MTSSRHRRDVVLGVAAALSAFVLVVTVNAAAVFLSGEAGREAVARAEAVDLSREVVDRNDALLRPVPNKDGRWRLPVTLDAVDARFVDMLIAYEDGRFHGHPGVDPLALARAAWQLARHGRIVSGGSTITMQLARLLDPGSGRSLAAKLAQIRDALHLERSLSKARILELYLTLAPYGGNLEGARAASLAWFGKEPRRLTLAESALLVALPQAPEARRPDRHADTARRARDRVIARLEADGVIDGPEAALALATPVPDRRVAMPNHAPHIAGRTIRAAPDEGEWRLTLERGLQSRLERLAADRARSFDRRVSLAILVADHRTGEVLAEIGSPVFFDDARAGQVDMVRAVRSPGSALKPLIYGLAFEAGRAHPETLIEDRPTSFGSYRPRNFELDHQGTITVREALTRSLNIPAVRLLESVGPAELVARLRRAGARPVLPAEAAPGLPVALGGVGMTLDSLVTLFAGLAAGGTPVALSRDPDRPPPRIAGSQFLDARAAWLVTDVLADTPPPAGRAGVGLAYKTGTSYGYRDAWAVGYDGRHVIGVWVGRPDGAPVPGLNGRDAAAPILFDAFARLDGARTPLPGAPPGTLIAEERPLPPALRRFAGDLRDRSPTAPPEGAPEIVFPPEGARIALGLSNDARARPLMIKLDGGTPPFRWFVNGRPMERPERRREAAWEADGAGFSTLSVVDAEGRAASVSVFLE